MTNRALALVVVVVSGCGSALPHARIATPGPEGPSAALSPEVVDRWAEARGAYDAALASGFDAASCTDVAARFDALHDLPEAIYMRGLALRACGDGVGASEAFHRAITLRSTLCGARVAIALEHDEAGRFDASRTELERAVHDDPRCVEGYVNLARAERRDPNGASAALDDLRRALAIDSRSMAAFHQMALVYLDQAARMRGVAPRVQGGGIALPIQTHDVDAAARLLDLASVVCRQAQLVDPDYAPLYNTWALVAIQRGEIVEALAMLERARTLDPSLFEAAMNFGELTLSFRGYADAAAAFTRASELRPGDYDAWIGLGAAQRGLGALDAAETAYTRAIAIDAARPEAYFDLGLLYQDHRGGDATAMHTAEGYYRAFVERARDASELAPVVEAVTRRCPPSCGPDAHPSRRAGATCAMGRLQQITEALCMLGT